MITKNKSRESLSKIKNIHYCQELNMDNNMIFNELNYFCLLHTEMVIHF